MFEQSDQLAERDLSSSCYPGRVVVLETDSAYASAEVECPTTQHRFDNGLFDSVRTTLTLPNTAS